MPEGSAIFLVDPQGRVLLQQRDDAIGPAGVGRWAVPGGGREGDESPAATIRREFTEETGATLTSITHFGDYRGMMRPDENTSLLHAFCSNNHIPRESIEVFEGLDFQYWHPADFDSLPMNPKTRILLQEFASSAAYAELVSAPRPSGAAVLEIDRWGRLLMERHPLGRGDLATEDYRLPSAPLLAGESPDAGALRLFEEQAGALLPALSLFRAYRRTGGLPNGPFETTHVYYHDADLDVEDLGDGAQSFLYVDPQAIPLAPMGAATRTVLLEFLESPAYKAMFH